MLYDSDTKLVPSNGRYIIDSKSENEIYYSFSEDLSEVEELSEVNERDNISEESGNFINIIIKFIYI